MRVFTSLAQAPMMEPSKAMAEPNMKNLQSTYVTLELEHRVMADHYGREQAILPPPAKDVR